jgi:LPS sulfotransferase NodH
MNSKKYNNYIIATLPRTGSTYLCELLSRNHMGVPYEDFNIFIGSSPFARSLVIGESTEEYIKRFFIPKRTNSGILCTKLMSHWLEIIRTNMSSYAKSYSDMLTQLFPDFKVIFLTRKNKVKQAISWIKASKTKQWIKASPTTEIDYEPKPFEIQECLQRIFTLEQVWRDTFEDGGIEPLKLIYEDFIENVESTLEKINNYVGFGCSNFEKKTKICRVQSNQSSEKIYETFCQQYSLERKSNEKFYLQTIRNMVE